MSSCPLPISNPESILLAHGGGGALTQRLLERVILPRFRNPALDQAHDGAVLAVPAGSLAFSTDGHVVRPLEFPGGNIGTLAVHGTINDLAMCGARPLWLAAGLILEEGLSIELLERILDSMAAACADAGVELVTGDTKVVERGHGDGIFITTSGIGSVVAPHPVGPRHLQVGDAILLSGDLGRHGIAILAARERLGFDGVPDSDCAPLFRPVLDLLARGITVHCLRDLTRGGLAAALHEIASTSGHGVWIDESRIPVCGPVRSACELLGLDPLHVANEGRFVAFVPECEVAQALDVLSGHEVSRRAVRIGTVTRRAAAPVLLETVTGATRVLPYLSGEQLPRIC